MQTQLLTAEVLSEVSKLTLKMLFMDRRLNIPGPRNTQLQNKILSDT